MILVPEIDLQGEFLEVKVLGQRLYAFGRYCQIAIPLAVYKSLSFPQPCQHSVFLDLDFVISTIVESFRSISNREEVLYNRIWKLLLKSENLAQLSYSRGLIIIEGVTYPYDTRIESKELCKRD